MNIKVIDNYVKNLTKNDIYYFLIKKNILFSNYEIDFIYNYIKNNYIKIIKNTPDETLNTLKNKLSKNSYEQILKLYSIYKEDIFKLKKIIVN